MDSFNPCNLSRCCDCPFISDGTKEQIGSQVLNVIMSQAVRLGAEDVVVNKTDMNSCLMVLRV